jgi:hypothetical protein
VVFTLRQKSLLSVVYADDNRSKLAFYEKAKKHFLFFKMCQLRAIMAVVYTSFKLAAFLQAKNIFLGFEMHQLSV